MRWPRVRALVVRLRRAGRGLRGLRGRDVRAHARVEHGGGQGPVAAVGAGLHAPADGDDVVPRPPGRLQVGQEGAGLRAVHARRRVEGPPLVAAWRPAGRPRVRGAIPAHCSAARCPPWSRSTRSTATGPGSSSSTSRRRTRTTSGLWPRTRGPTSSSARPGTRRSAPRSHRPARGPSRSSSPRSWTTSRTAWPMPTRRGRPGSIRRRRGARRVQERAGSVRVQGGAVGGGPGSSRAAAPSARLSESEDPPDQGENRPRDARSLAVTVRPQPPDDQRERREWASGTAPALPEVRHRTEPGSWQRENSSWQHLRASE